MSDKLKYNSESDRIYGAAGMAISAVLVEGENFLTAIDIDAPAGEMMQLSEDFYFASHQRVAAKAVWHSIITAYNLMTAMAVGNYLCRSLIAQSIREEGSLRIALEKLILEAGSDECELDEDESQRLFSKHYNYLYRAFSHPGVQSLARSLAETLTGRRHLSNSELREILSPLRRL